MSAPASQIPPVLNKKTILSSGYSNPILNDGEDPWIIFHKGYYHLIQNHGQFTKQESITLTSAKTLSELKFASEVVIWEPKTGDHTKELWAPELHRFKTWYRHRWYVYYAASDGNNINHRMYVLESNTNKLTDGFHEKGRIHTIDDECWGIDMTVFEHTDGFKYAVWSGWENPNDGFPQNLYIAKMKNPWTLIGNRVCISCPEHHWEKSEGLVNEGPQVLQRNGRTRIIYSADGSWTRSYKLGQLDLLPDADPLNPKSWIKKADPVFETGQTKILGPGHPSFLRTRDKKDLMIYHAKKSSKHNWNREVRVKEFAWHEDGSPNFGEPI